VPDVTTMTPEQAEEKLRDAGFEKIRRTTSASLPEQKDRVMATNPSANSTSAITNEITIIVGSGPGSKVVPDCTGQTVQVCTDILRASGFSKIFPVEVDSPEPAGRVLGTNPAAGPPVPLDGVIQIQVSLGNQFFMPNLRNQFWVDAEPLLRSLGWTGELIKLPNAQNSGAPSNAVATQDPAPNTPTTYSAPITLSFAQ
jgi:serine/threonine-protein kinase